MPSVSNGGSAQSVGRDSANDSNRDSDSDSDSDSAKANEGDWVLDGDMEFNNPNGSDANVRDDFGRDKGQRKRK